MGENFKRKDELNTLIKTFENQLKNNALGFYQIEQLEEIIAHYTDLGKNKMALKTCAERSQLIKPVVGVVGLGYVGSTSYLVT